MRSVHIFRNLFLFCIALLTIRALRTGHYSFFFLLWNLFLAWLPYWIIKGYEKTRSNAYKILLVSLTVLFLPNAPYLLTDLFHLTKHLVAPLWFDLVLILSFAMFGLFLFILTTDRLFGILSGYFKSKLIFNCVKLLIILSNGYGIYLGRYLRFNSWDVISHPHNLALNMFHSVFDQDNYKETLAVTLTFSVFLYLIFEIYEAFKKKTGEQQHELLQGPH